MAFGLSAEETFRFAASSNWVLVALWISLYPMHSGCPPNSTDFFHSKVAYLFRVLNEIIISELNNLKKNLFRMLFLTGSP